MQVINLYLSSNPSGPLVDSLLTWQRHSAGTLTDTRMIEQSISIKILFTCLKNLFFFVTRQFHIGYLFKALLDELIC